MTDNNNDTPLPSSDPSQAGSIPQASDQSHQGIPVVGQTGSSLDTPQVPNPHILPGQGAQNQQAYSHAQQSPAQSHAQQPAATQQGYPNQHAPATQASGVYQHSQQQPYGQTAYQTNQAQSQYQQQQYQPVAQQTHYQQAPTAEQAAQIHQSYQHADEPQKRTGKGLAFLVGLLGVIVGAALSVGALYIATSGFSFSGSVDTSNIVIEPSPEDTGLAEAVAAKVTPSVVNIDVYAAQTSNPLEDFFGQNTDGSDSNSSVEQTGLGSGVILTEDGYIITNNHVIEGSDRLLVSVNDEQYEATVAGTDPSSDLAVIKIEASGLTPIEMGDSDEVNVGEWVMAVGSPFGLEKSVSTGIVSALYRSTAMESQSGITIYANLIQTDAAINPGNSGGALVDDEGRLIGINTLINSTSGSSSGVGFALPSNYAFSIAEQIISGKGVEHPFLGVTLYSVDAAVANELGLSVDSGAYIESVQADSPAEEAGLQAGDVITSVDGKTVSTSAELIIEVRGHEIGSTVTLRVNRSGENLDLNVVLGSTTS